MEGVVYPYTILRPDSSQPPVIGPDSTLASIDQVPVIGPGKGGVSKGEGSITVPAGMLSTSVFRATGPPPRPALGNSIR